MRAKPSKTMQLTERQHLAIEKMVSGQSLTDIAKEMKLSRNTLTGWKKQPEFQAAIRARQAEIFQDAKRKLFALTDAAIDAISRELDSKGSGELALRFLELIGIVGLASAEVMKAVETGDREETPPEEERILGVPRLERIDREIVLLTRERERLQALGAA